jgi:hypothetical protein
LNELNELNESPSSISTESWQDIPIEDSLKEIAIHYKDDKDDEYSYDLVDMVDNLVDDMVDNDIKGRKVFSPYHIGEKVEINWDGNWYLGEVYNLNRKDFTYAIEFMNWDEMEGIWLDIENNVGSNRLRQPTFMKTGMSCQIIYNSDWYDGTIIVDGHEVNFQYDDSNTMIEYDIDSQRLRWIEV